MAAPSPYQACLKDMYSLRRFGIKLELSTIRNILKGLDHPQKKFAGIHIAGTNGKGSIASGLASILKAAGFRVGLYTSPHLVKFNERIQIDGREISDSRVVEACNAVRNVHYGDREPTFFEFATAMALYEFARAEVEWGIIETGMGGRLDATNIIRPAVCVISNISLEHKSYLGGTIAEIAAEKAGIIKKNTPVVTGVRQPQAIAVVEKLAAENDAPVFRLGKDFRLRRKPRGGFDYYGIDNRWKQMTTRLIGHYQADNAAIALAACEVLQKQGVPLAEKHLRDGLGHIHWPGRLEIVSHAPQIILDGAHNLMAARNLARFLDTAMRSKRVTMVLGMLDDKPYREMLRSLVPGRARIVLTRPVIDRALEPEQLLAEARQWADDIVTFPHVDAAVEHAVTTAKADEVVCIAGSLYVVGEAKQALARMGVSRNS